MIFYQNKDIVKKIKEEKYNNLYLNLDVEDIENDTDVIPHYIDMIENNLESFHQKKLIFNSSFYLSLFQEKIIINIAVK